MKVYKFKMFRYGTLENPYEIDELEEKFFSSKKEAESYKKEADKKLKRHNAEVQYEADKIHTSIHSIDVC